MHYGPLLFLGAFLTFAFSWCGLVLMPQLQYGRMTEQRLKETGRDYPPVRSGLAEEGRAIYQANGCIYCHSQQVRQAGFGADLARGWGRRRSVARDYLHDKPVLLGTMRTGPDLTNIGLRQPGSEWPLSHLYDPTITSKGSLMPPFRFLFELRKVGPNRSPDALRLTGAFAPPSGREVVPRHEAHALVAYLQSLRADAALPEAPLGK